MNFSNQDHLQEHAGVRLQVWVHAVAQYSNSSNPTLCKHHEAYRQIDLARRRRITQPDSISAKIWHAQATDQWVLPLRPKGVQCTMQLMTLRGNSGQGPRRPNQMELNPVVQVLLMPPERHWMKKYDRSSTTTDHKCITPVIRITIR